MEGIELLGGIHASVLQQDLLLIPKKWRREKRINLCSSRCRARPMLILFTLVSPPSHHSF